MTTLGDRKQCIFSVLLGLGLLLAASSLYANAVHDACEADVKTYCDGVQRGKGRIKECLDTNQERLSETCKTAMLNAKAACYEDRQRFCKDVLDGRGRIMECLKKHQDEISQQCRDSYEK